ncbi:MAG TPA: acyl-ACP desaturase [Acidimicrobiales bacterium]|nr:acyl-ACP desaturase [Acidimicrobiales bacterium]
MEETALLHELEPTVATLLDRHLETAKEWFPHELVPWGRGRDFQPNEDWDPNEYEMPDTVRSALFVNLLTEDNLPYYFAHIDSVFKDGPWRAWNRRWTAEEGRHSIVMRDYLTVTRALDPVDLERGRMQQVSTAVVPEPETVADALVYVALQELATRISHRNTGKLLTDRAGYDVMARVAADENLHYLFYRDATSAAIELDPSTVVIAIERQVREFAMPGVGIPNFATHARRIADAGVYDFIEHHDHILVPVVLRSWRVESLEGLTPEAEQARERLVSRVAKVGKAAQRLRERRAERTERAERVPSTAA